MTGKTHLAIGVLSGLLIYQYLKLDMSSAVLVGAAAIGALLPDLDAPAGTLARLLPFNPFSLLGHRGILHSALVLGLGAALWYFNQQPLWAIFLLAGYASHLLGDAITIQGIPLLYPIPFKFRISPIPIQSGGLFDMLLFFSTWLGVGALLTQGWLW
jgi:inner membrane protein